MKLEYIRRHEAIWPEMLDMLQQAGVSNYSIWLWNGLLFGYYQSDDLEKTDAYKMKSRMQARWNSYMSDIISTTDSEGNQITAPECAFLME